MDELDKPQGSWRLLSPEMDTDDVVLIGRIMKINQYVSLRLEDELAPFGIKQPSFDVLNALLSAGAPYALTPNQLLKQTSVSSGAMTNRINKLEKKDLVKRVPSQKDKRSFQVALTANGERLVKDAVIVVNQLYAGLASDFSPKDKVSLNKKLRKYLEKLGT